jgi:hypothetical protein
MSYIEPLFSKLHGRYTLEDLLHVVENHENVHEYYNYTIPKKIPYIAAVGTLLLSTIITGPHMIAGDIVLAGVVGATIAPISNKIFKSKLANKIYKVFYHYDQSDRKYETTCHYFQLQLHSIDFQLTLLNQLVKLQEALAKIEEFAEYSKRTYHKYLDDLLKALEKAFSLEQYSEAFQKIINSSKWISEIIQKTKEHTILLQYRQKLLNHENQVAEDLEEVEINYNYKSML